MVLKTSAIAGTIEANDIMIALEPGEQGIEIHLSSTVEEVYGAEIRRVIHATLRDMGVEQARLTAVDKGALDCVIMMRVRSAVRLCSRDGALWNAG